MTTVNMNDPAQRAAALASGLIWQLSPKAQQLVCDDIIAGRLPCPSYLPPAALLYMRKRGFEPPEPMTNDANGAGL